MGPELEYSLEGSPNADCLLNIDGATPRGSNQALDFHIVMPRTNIPRPTKPNAEQNALRCRTPCTASAPPARLIVSRAVGDQFSCRSSNRCSLPLPPPCSAEISPACLCTVSWSSTSVTPRTERTPPIRLLTSLARTGPRRVTRPSLALTSIAPGCDTTRPIFDST